MHGRLKVKTTAQQEAERKAQREEKLKTYETAMAAIFEHREMFKNASQNEEMKEEDNIRIQKTLMKMTSGVLMANPDISTLWNIRKEVLEKSLIELDDKPKEHDQVLQKELTLTISCLHDNPKGYGTWHHRCWSMLKMKSPDWQYELSLCDKYLSLDERNFHCWDYRRFIVTNASISPDQELRYSEDKINVNFSNYSAWHYRSKLLPMVEENNSAGNGINESQRRTELDLGNSI